MAYADVGQVIARAGKVGSSWGTDTVPSDGDIETFLDDAQAYVDACLGALGAVTPVTDEVAAKVLGVLTIDGALILALDATFPGGIPDEVEGARSRAQKRWDDGIKDLCAGSHPAARRLGALSGSGGSTSFWLVEPSYALNLTPQVLLELNASLAPQWAANQVL